MDESRTDRFVRILQRCLLLFFWSWFVLWYSIKAEREDEAERGFAERAIVGLRDVPRTVMQFAKVSASSTDHQELELKNREGLFALGELQDVDEVPENLYILFYRYEGGDAGTVYLRNVKNGDVAKKWDIPLPEIFEDLERLNEMFIERRRAGKLKVKLEERVANFIGGLRIGSPWMAEDGGLLFNCCALGHTYRLNQDSEIIWKSKEITHHSMELDSSGNIWNCALDLENEIAEANGFREDAVLCLGPKGESKGLYSISQMLIDNNLFDSLANTTPSGHQDGPDPYHLNDVEPAESDGSFWKKGDVFLSLRNKGLVMQFRPSDRSVQWYKQGPWLNQHDVSILNDSQISLFNNNRGFLLGKAKTGSNVSIYDFADDSVEFIANDMFYSAYNGRQVRTSSGLLLVEETGEGVYLIIDQENNVIARFYLPYYSNANNAMYPAWGRFYLKNGEEFEVQR